MTSASFAWLAHDDAEAEQLRRIVEAFGDKGTLDPIGFGPIRDAVADLLFPGISTIQTRARYFVFVPRIFQALEENQVPPEEFATRLRAEEVRLIHALVAGQRVAGAAWNDPDWLGIIGREAQSKVRNLPSTIYWNGMQAFGIRQFSGSVADYRRRLRAYYRGLDAVQHDEDGDPVGVPPRNWDPHVPEAGQLAGDTESFHLTFEESEYLTAQIRLSQPRSLTSVMLVDDASSDAEAPWEVPTTDNALATLLRDAEHFSLLSHGVQLLYNVLLYERWRTELGAKGENDNEEMVRERASEWAQEVSGRIDELADVAEAFPGFLHRLRGAGARVPGETQRFFQSWIQAATVDPHAAVENADQAEAVRSRERQLKGGLAKLVARPALESWAMRAEPQADERLTFRWDNARRIVDDVLAGRSTS